MRKLKVPRTFRQKLKSVAWFYLVIIPLIIGQVIGIVLIYAFIAALAIIIIGPLVAISLISWACGAKFSITESKKHIGYVRWFRFYPS